MSLVIVRCQRCRHMLGSLDAMPEDWSGFLAVSRCRKCVLPTPRRLMGVLRQHHARGFAMGLNIPLADLKPYALKAQARGKAVTYEIPPLPQPE